MRYCLLLHVLLLVYSVHLLHCAAYIISDLCIAFYVARRPATGFWRSAMNRLRDATAPWRRQ